MRVSARIPMSMASPYILRMTLPEPSGFWLRIPGKLPTEYIRHSTGSYRGHSFAFLTHTRATANMVTVAGLLVAIFSALMYARGSYPAYVAGAILFFISGLIDEMDGMLARLKFQESAFGTWFEGFVDNVTYLLLFAGMTAGLYRQHGKAELMWGIALIVGCVLSVIVVALQRKTITDPNRPHEYQARMNRWMESDSSLISRVARQIHIFIKKGVAVHYVLLFTVLGGLSLFLRIAAISANLTWTVVSYFTWRFTRTHRTAAVPSAI